MVIYTNAVTVMPSLFVAAASFSISQFLIRLEEHCSPHQVLGTCILS